MSVRVDWDQCVTVTADDVRGLESEPKKIPLGHRCEGMDLIQRCHEHSWCAPGFTQDGFVQGCDDTSPVRIAFCPFCGEELKP